MSNPTEITYETKPNTKQRINAEITNDELTQLKFELLKAEVRLAKARAGVVCAEADVKVLGSKLKTLINR